LEYELEYITADDVGQAAVYHVHNVCFWAWETERRKLASKRTAAASVELSGVCAEARVVEDEYEAPGGQGST
jgi:hypothetical protein